MPIDPLQLPRDPLDLPRDQPSGLTSQADLQADPQPSRWQALWEGFKYGAARTAEGVGQTAAHVLQGRNMVGGVPLSQVFPSGSVAGRSPGALNRPITPETIRAGDAEIAQRAQAYQQNPAVRAHPGFATGGQIGGEAAATAPLMLLPGGGAGLAGRLGMGAAGGALGGITQPVTGQGDFGAQKLRQAGIGAATGGTLAGAGAYAGNLLAPELRGDAATLAGRGVPLSPARMFSGETIGPIARTAEDKAKSLPILGDFIANMQKHSLDGFNRGTINQALEPIGASLPRNTRVGNQAIKTAGDAISTAFDQALAKVPHVRMDPQFMSDLKAVMYDASQRREVGDNVRSVINRLFFNQLKKSRPITGKEAQTAISELDRQSKALLKDQAFFRREEGKHLGQAREALLDAVDRQYPEAGAELEKARDAWSMLVRIEDAGGRRAGSEGVFTPMDLLLSIKQHANTVRRRSFVRGDEKMEPWAQTAQRLLPSKYPDSGTAGRLALGALTGAIGTGLAGIVPAAKVAAGLTAAGAGYRALGAAARSAPGAAQRALATGARRGGVAAGPAGGTVIQRNSVPTSP